MSNIKVITNRDDIVAVANAIRSKIGETKNMTLGEMASNIQNMSVGGGDGGQDLSAEIAAQKELIAQLDSILDDKASGGSDADLVEEINAQKELIAELSSILDSKAAGGSGGVSLNIAYGDTAPEDTTKLWVKAAEPNVVNVTNGISFDVNSLEKIGDLAVGSTNIKPAVVGEKVYLFGGSYLSGSSSMRMETIRVYDPKLNSTVTLDATITSGVSSFACASVGTKVYLFGGYNQNTSQTVDEISIFDTETETITICDTKLPKALSSLSTSVVGTNIYIFGGNQTSIYVFDTETETIQTCSAVMPFSSYEITAATVGSKIYTFGGYGSGFLNAIYEFDTVGNTIKKLSTTLPTSSYRIAAVSFGTMVYLFGGERNYGQLNTIIAFDAGTNTIEQIGTLPTASFSIAAAAVGTKAYLFGGQVSYSQYLTDIYDFTASAPLDYGTMVMQYTTGSGLFQIVNSGALTIELCPVSVHIGDENGSAQPVEAFIYKDGAWTAI